jgi:hypothetical protein
VAREEPLEVLEVLEVLEEEEEEEEEEEDEEEPAFARFERSLDVPLLSLLARALPERVLASCARGRPPAPRALRRAGAEEEEEDAWALLYWFTPGAAEGAVGEVPRSPRPPRALLSLICCTDMCFSNKKPVISGWLCRSCERRPS